MSKIFVPIDTPSVLFALQGAEEVFCLTISEIMQCLQVAELEDDFPDLPESWKKEAIPEHRLIENKEKACA